MMSVSQRDEYRRLSKELNPDLDSSENLKNKPEEDKKKKIKPINVEKLESIPP